MRSITGITTSPSSPVVAAWPQRKPPLCHVCSLLIRRYQIRRNFRFRRLRCWASCRCRRRVSPAVHASQTFLTISRPVGWSPSTSQPRSQASETTFEDPARSARRSSTSAIGLHQRSCLLERGFGCCREGVGNEIVHLSWTSSRSLFRLTLLSRYYPLSPLLFVFTTLLFSAQSVLVSLSASCTRTVASSFLPLAFPNPLPSCAAPGPGSTVASKR